MDSKAIAVDLAPIQLLHAAAPTSSNEAKNATRDDAPIVETNAQPLCSDLVVNSFHQYLDSWSANPTVSTQENTFLDGLFKAILSDNKVDAEERSLVLHHFGMTLEELKVEFRFRPFGSTVTGLAFYDADFDTLVETPQVGIRELIDRVMALMCQSENWMENISVTSVGLPVVSATHRETGRKCDFTFPHHMYSYYNSILNKHLVDCDPRIAPLTMLIKYWFRANDLAGHPRFINYGVFLMVVFYLQMIPEPILPPLIDYQRNVPPHMVGPWNVAVDLQHRCRNTNESSVLSLVFGFFEYYNKFNFEKNLICPQMGRVYDRPTFHDRPHPVEFGLYFNHLRRKKHTLLDTESLICVQDPHRLNVNLARCRTSLLVFEQHVRTMCAVIKLNRTLPAFMSSDETLLAELFRLRPIPRSQASLDAEMAERTARMPKHTVPTEPTPEN